MLYILLIKFICLYFVGEILTYICYCSEKFNIQTCVTNHKIKDALIYA